MQDYIYQSDPGHYRKLNEGGGTHILLHESFLSKYEQDSFFIKHCAKIFQNFCFPENLFPLLEVYLRKVEESKPNPFFTILAWKYTCFDEQQSVANYESIFDLDESKMKLIEFIKEKNQEIKDYIVLYGEKSFVKNLRYQLGEDYIRYEIYVNNCKINNNLDRYLYMWKNIVIKQIVVRSPHPSDYDHKKISFFADSTNSSSSLYSSEVSRQSSYNNRIVVKKDNWTCQWLSAFLFILYKETMFYNTFCFYFFQGEKQKDRHLFEFLLKKKEWDQPLFRIFYEMMREIVCFHHWSEKKQKERVIGQAFESIVFSNFCEVISKKMKHKFNAYEVLLYECIDLSIELNKHLQNKKIFGYIKGWYIKEFTSKGTNYDANCFQGYIRTKENKWESSIDSEKEHTTRGSISSFIFFYRE